MNKQTLLFILALILTGCLAEPDRGTYYQVQPYPSTYQLYMDNYRIQQDLQHQRNSQTQYNLPLSMCQQSHPVGCP